jgi:phosphoglucosamine mutase
VTDNYNVFGTDGVRGIPNQDIFEPLQICCFGVAIGEYLKKKVERPIVLIGKDTRLSCYMLEYILAGALTSKGVDVYLTGPIPTGGISYLSQSMRVDLGIMVSASHNSWEYNGIKILDSQGVKISVQDEEEISKLLLLAQNKRVNFSSDHLGRIRRLDDGIWRYLAFIKSLLPRSLRAAYFIAPKVFWELGAEVISTGCEPNGFNINQGVGSLYPEHLKKILQDSNADIGFCFDGDADRLVVVTKSGKILTGDALLAIFTKFRQYSFHSDLKGVVGTLVSNKALEILVTQEGLQFVRAAVGDRNILAEMQSRGFSLGGEDSGHIIFLERANWGDGLITALAFIELVLKSGATPDNLAEVYRPHPSVSFDCELKGPVAENFFAEVENLKNDLSEKFSVRSVIRKSGTENKLRVYLESSDEKALTEARETVSAFLSRLKIN